MIKKILKNEIQLLIGHKPNHAEYKSALEYLGDNVDDYFIFSDVKAWLYNWRDDCLVQCEECGGYFLELQEFDHNNRVLGRRFCSRECCDNWEYWHPDEKPEISQYV